MELKNIAICGATGQQGTGVIHALLKMKRWNITALTRNPESEKALLLKKNINVIQADLVDVDSLLLSKNMDDHLILKKYLKY